MPIGYIFWAIFLVIIILNIVGWRAGPNWEYGWTGNLVILILIFLLGWAEFGFILQGGGTRHGFCAGCGMSLFG
jgi:hypothetical protein